MLLEWNVCYMLLMMHVINLYSIHGLLLMGFIFVILNILWEYLLSPPLFCQYS